MRAHVCFVHLAVRVEGVLGDGRVAAGVVHQAHALADAQLAGDEDTASLLGALERSAWGAHDGSGGGGGSGGGSARGSLDGSYAAPGVMDVLAGECDAPMGGWDKALPALGIWHAAS